MPRVIGYGIVQALSELTDNTNRLRTQLREIEIQAETQMQSRLSIAQESEAPFDPRKALAGAEDALRRWVFVPARHGDKAVRSWIRVRFRFEL